MNNDLGISIRGDLVSSIISSAFSQIDPIKGCGTPEFEYLSSSQKRRPQHSLLT